ncbi:hypothetical protein GCM10023116_46650 [Kistimonas scapharcae]|uniref:Uncharacterized protein n=1 Tax=Kistimonas scapharcae TaxID=1036133 RepID=A0ABP8V9K7_9GAMM
MEPIALISAASSILKLTGLDRKIGQLINGDKGAAVAEHVVDIAETITGESDPGKISQRLEQQNSLKAQLRLALLQQRTELERLAVEDRNSAREMQKAALAQGDTRSKRFIYNFAWFWSVVASAFIFIAVMYPIPESNQRFADTVLGFVLGTIIATILQFFYGSMLRQDGDG